MTILRRQQTLCITLTLPATALATAVNGIYPPVCQKRLLRVPRALSRYTVTVQESNPGLET